MVRGLPARSELIRCLAEAGRALHARELATRFGVREGDYPELLGLLDRLCLDGAVKRLAGNRYRVAPLREPEGWEGILSGHPRGFGFVASAGREDVYVAPDGIGGALHGDRVLVSVVARSGRGAEGRIEGIVERRSPRVAGVLRCRGSSAWLEPDDSRIRGPIVLSGRVSAALDGQAAVVTITRFPTFTDENPQAELVRVLGTPGDPKVEVAKILEREALTDEHPAPALGEARQAVATVLGMGSDLRRDITSMPLPTIDPEDARDHDDAIWAERTSHGYRLWVAIADVSEFVQKDGALDHEAARRGCSVYLPDRAIPMLPPELSAEACSLMPGADRPCLYVVAELDQQARIKSYEVGEARMRSAASLTYAEVAGALGWSGRGGKSPRVMPLREGLLVADEVARKLRRARFRRGALQMVLPEPQVLIDPQSSVPLDVVRREADPGVARAYQLVEEFMLLANELVADWLGQREAPTLYRVHAKPDPTKLERLSEIAGRMGVACELDTLLTPNGLSRWLARLGDHPRRGVLEMLLLRSLKQAAYDVTNVGHFGLASAAYLHFTSPIRRYPDLVVHRTVKALLRGGRPDRSDRGLEQLRVAATQSSARERAAAEVEREVVDLYRALLMRDHIGRRCEGIVSGISATALYVTLDHPFVDVMVPFEALGTDTYEVLDDQEAVVGQRSGETLELGDGIAVVIQDVSVVRRLVVGRRAASVGSERRRKGTEMDQGRRAKSTKPAPAQSHGARRRPGSRERASSSAPAERGRRAEPRERSRTKVRSRGR